MMMSWSVSFIVNGHFIVLSCHVSVIVMVKPLSKPESMSLSMLVELVVIGVAIADVGIIDVIVNGEVGVKSNVIVYINVVVIVVF